MALSPQPARPLTSREIANLLGALAAGFVINSDPQDVMDAFKHITKFETEYITVWKAMHEAAKLKKV
jgi:hypothetical protein